MVLYPTIWKQFGVFIESEYVDSTRYGLQLEYVIMNNVSVGQYNQPGDFIGTSLWAERQVKSLGTRICLPGRTTS